MAKKSDTIQVKVRMTRSMHQKLLREAERDGQTLNAEILRRLKVADRYQAEIEKMVAETKTAVEISHTAEHLRRLENTAENIRQSIAELLARSEQSIAELKGKGDTGLYTHLDSKKEDGDQ
jgi:hypothetical protein